jgi:hypothetical protein
MSQTIRLGVREPEARRRAGGEVLHEHVGLVEDQPLEHALRFGMLHVEREALLRAIGPHEVRGEAAHARVIAAREVADTGPLHLDHARAEIGELPRRERCRDRMLEGDDRDAFEGLHDRSPHSITAVASIVSQPS